MSAEDLRVEVTPEQAAALRQQAWSVLEREPADEPDRMAQVKADLVVLMYLDVTRNCSARVPIGHLPPSARAALREGVEAFLTGVGLDAGA